MEQQNQEQPASQEASTPDSKVEVKVEPNVEPKEQSTSATEPALKFSQADLDKIAGNVRKEARAAAIAEFIKEVGAESRDEVKAGYSEYLELSELSKNELEKVTERAEKLAADLEEERKKGAETASRADSRLIDYHLEGALRDAGLNPERMKLALRNVEREGLSIDGEEVSGVPEAVEALKGDSPEWFKGAQTFKAADATTGVQTSKTKIEQLSDEQFEDLRNRAMRGERITLP